MSAPSPRTPVSPHVRRVRRANLSPHGNFGGEPNFEAAVIRLPSGSYACSTPRLLPPRQLRTLPGSRAFHTTHRPAGYPNRDVALLHARHGQLAWLDSHQLDRGLVGRSLTHWAPPSGTSVEASVRPVMSDLEERQPSVAQAPHPLPGQPCALAAAPKRHEPVPHGLGAEGIQRPLIARHAVVVGVAPEDAGEPAPLLRDGLSRRRSNSPRRA